MAVTVPLNPERPTLPSVLSSTERMFEELSYCVEDLCPLRVAIWEEGSQNLPLQISTVSYRDSVEKLAKEILSWVLEGPVKTHLQLMFSR